MWVDVHCPHPSPHAWRPLRLLAPWRSSSRGSRAPSPVPPAEKRPTGSATVADLVALPEQDRYEIVDGELVQKEAGNGRHGQAQVSLAILLRGYRGGGGRGQGPGGWIFGSEVLVQFTGSYVRMPDVSGWKRERLPVMPKEGSARHGTLAAAEGGSVPGYTPDSGQRTADPDRGPGPRTRTEDPYDAYVPCASSPWC